MNLSHVSCLRVFPIPRSQRSASHGFISGLNRHELPANALDEIIKLPIDKDSAHFLDGFFSKRAAWNEHAHNDNIRDLRLYQYQYRQWLDVSLSMVLEIDWPEDWPVEVRAMAKAFEPLSGTYDIAVAPAGTRGRQRDPALLPGDIGGVRPYFINHECTEHFRITEERELRDGCLLK